MTSARVTDMISSQGLIEGTTIADIHRNGDGHRESIAEADSAFCSPIDSIITRGPYGQYCTLNARLLLSILGTRCIVNDRTRSSLFRYFYIETVLQAIGNYVRLALLVSSCELFTA